jgi:hypothetical protein
VLAVVSEDDAYRLQHVVDGSLVLDSFPVARISSIDCPQGSCSHSDEKSWKKNALDSRCEMRRAGRRTVRIVRVLVTR